MANKKQDTNSSHQGKQIEDEIKTNVTKITDLERKQKESRTFGERLSEGIAKFAGSMVFVYIHVAWFTIWILINTVFGARIDPFPFTFLTFVVSLEAIFLSTFILINQNHETQLANRRNHLDLQINMLAEQENTKTLELLQEIAKQVGVKVDRESTQALIEEVDPEFLLEEIVVAEAENKAAADAAEAAEDPLR
jgi:uncharacterized membrane protein